MNAAVDLIIVGGGPAGAAAAILARGHGLTVALLEARPFPRDRPGETLHPGVEVIFRELGVLEAAQALSPLRPETQASRWGASRRVVAYGADDRGPWRAFQILRRDLDTLLLNRFRDIGGWVVQPAPKIMPIIEDGRVVGVRGNDLVLRAPITIDASGATNFLRRALAIPVVRHSPRLIAHFGYSKGTIRAAPELIEDGDGWTWTSQVTTELIAWVRLVRHTARVSPPCNLAMLPNVGRRGATDVTWRIADRIAGDGYFLVGEAAAVLDPAASHGVLRAMMSGMMAAHLVNETRAGRTRPQAAAQAYSNWFVTWFDRDAATMRDLYADLGSSWHAMGKAAACITHSVRQALNTG